jgi:hypothetical protein
MVVIPTRTGGGMANPPRTSAPRLRISHPIQGKRVGFLGFGTVIPHDTRDPTELLAKRKVNNKADSSTIRVVIGHPIHSAKE